MKLLFTYLLGPLIPKLKTKYVIQQAEKGLLFFLLLLGVCNLHVQSNLSDDESGRFLQVLMAALELCKQWNSLWAGATRGREGKTSHLKLCLSPLASAGSSLPWTFAV